MTINWEYIWNPFILVFMVIPLLTVIISFFVTKLSGKVWLSPIIVLICAISLQIFTFGNTFFIWAIIYFVISITTSTLTNKILN